MFSQVIGSLVLLLVVLIVLRRVACVLHGRAQAEREGHFWDLRMLRGHG